MIERPLGREEIQCLDELMASGENWLEQRAAGYDTRYAHEQFEVALADFRRAERKARKDEKKEARRNVKLVPGEATRKQSED